MTPSEASKIVRRMLCRGLSNEQAEQIVPSKNLSEAINLHFAD